MEIRELLQEYGYSSEETPIVIGSALCALEVNFVDVTLLYAAIFLWLAVSDIPIIYWNVQLLPIWAGSHFV